MLRLEDAPFYTNIQILYKLPAMHRDIFMLFIPREMELYKHDHIIKVNYYRYLKA
jgi:hypothetical protein